MQFYRLVRYVLSNLFKFYFWNNNNHAGCVPRTNDDGAWNAPYDIALLI